LGEQLEGIFGWNAQTSEDGIIPILERGKAICALHPILKEYHEKFPDNNVLKKWVHDVMAGAEKAFMTCGVDTGTKQSQSSALLGSWKGNSFVCQLLLICLIEQISIFTTELKTFWTLV
jgi:hypothetical protein